MSSPSDPPSTSPSLVTNPFIKKRNQDWTISPPPLKRKRQHLPAEDNHSTPATATATTSPGLSTSAAIEAGRLQITDHLSHFVSLLSRHTPSSFPSGTPRLPVAAYSTLFTASLQNPAGAHFVIHQHDHPVAGTHYDLRLQINGTSSASWAVMKGVPGDGNSRRLGRNATETRVHCLWNHLIETGSRETGSLLVWDMGSYEVLEKVEEGGGGETGSEGEEVKKREEVMTQQEKLERAFTGRKIRLRLKGTRLPRGYTVHLRLSAADDVEGRARALKSAMGPRPARRRRRVAGSGKGVVDVTDSEEDEYRDGGTEYDGGEPGLSAMEREIRELEDDMVRRTNAYPGASNTIDSVHQRRWFLSLDRPGSGLVKKRIDGKAVWVKDTEDIASQEDDDDDDDDDEQSSRLTFPFHVRGADHERSIVTGRLSAEVLRDEGVTDFVQRKGWRPILD